MENDRTSDRLLMLLKTRGGLTTKALAAALDISVPAVRQHLLGFGDDVEMHERRAGVGRPAQVWRLTQAAQSRFPDTHSELTVTLIDSIETVLGPDALDKVIDERYAKLLQSYRRRLDGVSSVAGKLRRLAAIRSEEGYMAEIKRDGDGWLLIENHCPICAAATRCQGFCRSELQLFRSVLGEGVSVERVEYLLESGQRCAYAVRG